MHSYDYRCKTCQHRFTLTYKTYQAYDAATPECPNCGSANLSRLIQRIAIQKPGRDFTRMSSNEMLGVLESGDSRQVGEMFQQIGGASPELGVPYHEATQKLLAGQKMDKVEQDLRESTASGTPSGTPSA
jgi:putative FmdB family regulatory protein